MVTIVAVLVLLVMTLALLLLVLHIFARIRRLQLRLAVMESRLISAASLTTLYKEVIKLEGERKCAHSSEELMVISERDNTLSPYTGLSIASWMEAGQKFLNGVLQYTGGMRTRITLPQSSAAGYPRVLDDGTLYGMQEQYLEAYARSMFLASALLKNEPCLTMHGRSVADYYREFLLRGVSRFDSASFGWMSERRWSQRIVETAAITICLTAAKESLWDPLTTREKYQVCSWLSQFKDIPLWSNNWLWFNVLINTFLKMQDFEFNDQLLRKNLLEIRRLHVDAGWFRDGDKFDFYSAWALQFYPIFWADWDGDTFPELRDEFYDRNDMFLESYVHIFSRRGEMPLWGRSICYRFAASSPLAIAFMRPSPPRIDAGFARRICSGNLMQFINHPEFLKDGIPSLGFYGENAALIDDYSCVASPLWCFKLFMALLLPPENPFWSATENEGFWSNPPKTVVLGNTGMRVKHDDVTGHSTLYAEQKVRQSDQRYSATYFDTRDCEYRQGAK